MIYSISRIVREENKRYPYCHREWGAPPWAGVQTKGWLWGQAQVEGTSVTIKEDPETDWRAS